MAIDFPNSPSVNDTFGVTGGPSWKWNGTTWDMITQSSDNGADVLVYGPAGTGAVDTTIKAKLDQTISVKDFGAAGDGVNDDTAEIQLAIDAAEAISAANTAAGASVYFPAGEYLISSQLVVDEDNISLYGDGPRISVLTTTQAAGNILKMSQSGAQQNSMAISGLGFSIEGNATSGAQLVLENVVDGNFTNLGFYGWWVGIDCIGINRCFFDNIVFQDNGRTGGAGAHGVHMRGDATSGGCSDNHFSNIQMIAQNASYDHENGMLIASADGLYITNSHFHDADQNLNFQPDDASGQQTLASVLISNCYFDATDATTGTSSLRFEGTASSGYRNIQISNCVIRAANEDGIFLNTTSQLDFLTISGCVIRDCGESGIFCNGTTTKHVTVSGCIFAGNNVDDGASDADMWIRGNNWVITGCVFEDGGASGRGLSLNSNADNCIVSACDFNQSTAGTVVVNSGTGNKLSSLAGAYVLRANGTATISAATSTTVTHGLSVTPSIADINVVATSDMGGSANHWWIDTVTSTQFNINVDTSDTVTFAWNADSEN